MWIASSMVTFACIQFLGCSGQTAEFETQRGKPMNESHFTVEHVRLTSDQPFGKVTAAFEARLGKFDPEVRKELATGGDLQAAGPRSKGWPAQAASCCSAPATMGRFSGWSGNLGKPCSTSSATRCSPSK